MVSVKFWSVLFLVSWAGLGLFQPAEGLDVKQLISIINKAIFSVTKIFEATINSDDKAKRKEKSKKQSRHSHDQIKWRKKRNLDDSLENEDVIYLFDVKRD
ncbi:uncharacterized protein LOC120338467 [Styela clava]|uniref:uncharacterized protein LOC120338467 n=1 Tax=Styela clava TaxID=7725 RepID=UPI00193A8BF6|nr:uncharacterized protein LOC120338467 [Styela clava]